VIRMGNPNIPPVPFKDLRGVRLPEVIT
jgi:hypothetical protein